MNIKSKCKKLTSGLLIISSMIFSLNAAAAPTSIEDDITAFVVEQSEQLVNEMTNQLKQSIAEELNEFSVTESIIWFSEDVAEVSTEAAPSNTVNQKVNNTNLLTKNSAE